MAIRVSFLAFVAGFSCILHPSTSWPVCAEPQLPRSDFLESSAVTPVEDSARPPSPSIEAKSDTRDAVEDPSVWVRLDFDAWAYAFAESSRAQTVGLVGAITYDVVMNQHVTVFVDRFTTRHRDVVGLWFQRSPQYLGMIRPHFRSKGLPDELAYTAMIESGFNPRAVSRAGAKGLWQFMAGTARLYGLRVDRWVDERLDPEKSTVAAAAYLRDLHRQFGSWALAQAAYNAGEMRVSRAIRLTGSSDFWDLKRTKHLRRETREFVPAIQAATIIGRDPDQYGFEIGGEAWDDTERVSVPPSTALRRLSTGAGLSLQMLRALNPTRVRGITPAGPPRELRI